MGTETQATDGHDDPVGIELVSVAVTLFLEGIDPRVITPRFLRCKRIMPDGLDPDMRSTYANQESAQIIYGDNSHRVSADRTSLNFEQFGTRMDPRHVNVPTIVGNYVRTVEEPYCSGFGIILGGFVEGSRPSMQNAITLLRSRDDEIRQDGPVPSMNIGATYLFRDKAVYLNIADFTLGKRDGVLFRATFHRETPDEDPGARVCGKLETWEEDLKEFRALVSRFPGENEP